MVSLNKETFVEGGGLINDVDAILTNFKFEMFNYNNKGPQAPALGFDIIQDDVDEPHRQYITVGSARDWKPSKDGKSIDPVGNATALNKGSNLAIFLQSLSDAGLPDDTLDEDISVLDDMRVHLLRVPAPKRNLKKEEGQSDREQTCLTVSEIHDMPGTAKVGKKSGATKPKAGAVAGAKPAAAAPKAAAGKKPAAKAEEAEGGGDEIRELAIETVMEIIMEMEGNTVKKAKLPSLVFKKVTDERKNAVSQLVFKDDFLKSVDSWKYENGTLSLAE